MERRKFSREFKLEAIKLVKERGVSFAQAGRDLDVHQNVLRSWVRDSDADPKHAFPGLGQMLLLSEFNPRGKGWRCMGFYAQNWKLLEARDK